MKIIAKDISFYSRCYAGVFAEVIHETETRYYVRPIDGYAKGGHGNKYVEKADVITTEATPEMWEAIRQADRAYSEQSVRLRQELIDAHSFAVEAIIQKKI